ncbi:MAG: ATP-binding protein [Anaerolineales bacterium]|nr:ATP-binding protein [Anaerolineales bacterium]
MPRFVDREEEIANLNRLLERPAGQFIIVYGRRRVGKTTLLLHWAKTSHLPYVYWVASRNTTTNLQRSLAEALWQYQHPFDRKRSGLRTPPQEMAATEEYLPEARSWRELLRYAVRVAEGKRFILILDELPYAVEADRALPSELQNAWDHDLKETGLIVAVAGSHVGMMVKMQEYQAPLYGRFTARLAVEPLDFAALAEFLPNYDAAQRVAVYAILGGIPAYLERFDSHKTLAANVQEEILLDTGMFRVEPFYLLSDEVREPRNYMAVLRAIGQGNHTLEKITLGAGFQTKQHTSTYLGRLQELRLIYRDTPATIPEDRQTTQGRYYLRDAYLRFYFRFIAPHERLLEQGLIPRLWEIIQGQIRAFVGATAFEDLCRQWVLRQAIRGALPFMPDRVGSHWGKDAQVDVVAIRWDEKQILLGEAKWGTDAVRRKVLTDLMAKTPKVVPDRGEGWTVHYALFARTGFTDAVQAEAARHNVLLVDLERLDRDLARRQGGDY